jgi:hypothetical protein
MRISLILSVVLRTAVRRVVMERDNTPGVYAWLLRLRLAREFLCRDEARRDVDRH